MKRLSVALNDYDRTFPLLSGQIIVEGVELDIQTLHPNEILEQLAQSKELDVAEIPFTSYLSECSNGKQEFIGIPVFPSRQFCHSFFYVRENSLIKSPQELKGKTIGVTDFKAPEVFWGRVLLKEEYGLDYSDIKWIVAPEASLKTQLLDRDLDAIITIQNVRPLMDNMEIKCLFQNAAIVEKKYYQKTKIFPIFSVIVVRKTASDIYPQLLKVLYDALHASKELAIANLRATAVLYSNYPWQFQAIEETLELLGDDIWPYGIEQNREELIQAVHSAFDQGLIDKVIELDGMYPKN